MEQVLFVLLGWLLGLLSPAIAEYIRRHYSERSLRAALLTEMTDLGCALAVVAYITRRRPETFTDTFIDWLIFVLQSYEGPESYYLFAEQMQKVREIPEAERVSGKAALKQAHVGLDLKQFRLPFLTSKLAELWILPIELQQSLMVIHGQLNIFNQQVVSLQKHHDRTFDSSIRSEDMATVKAELERGYQNLSERAEGIARRITTLKERWTNRGPWYHSWFKTLSAP